MTPEQVRDIFNEDIKKLKKMKSLASFEKLAGEIFTFLADSKMQDSSRVRAAPAILIKEEGERLDAIQGHFYELETVKAQYGFKLAVAFLDQVQERVSNAPQEIDRLYGQVLKGLDSFYDAIQEMSSFQDKLKKDSEKNSGLALRYGTQRTSEYSPRFPWMTTTQYVSAIVAGEGSPSEIMARILLEQFLDVVQPGEPTEKISPQFKPWREEDYS